MADPPIKAKMLFDNFAQDKVGIPLNVTDAKAQNLGGVLLFIITVDFLATMFLMTITYVTSVKDGMKLCEKLLVYNLLFADFLLEMVVFFRIGPATLENQWNPAKANTVWTAFIHTCCVFHPHVATATICYMIALSMTDAYRYEMANDMKHMSVVVISTLCVTVCFCSLPATEDYGYTVLHNWMGPSFNIGFQYGSLFMSLGIMGIVCSAMAISIFRLMEARKFFQENKARINVRTLVELDQDLVFCVTSLVSACLLFPLIIGVPDPVLMFFPRITMYLCPVVRVASLLTTCPLFQFAFFGNTEDVDDLLEGLDDDVLLRDGDQADITPIEALIEERMAEVDALAAYEKDEPESDVDMNVLKRNSTEL